MAIGFDFVIAAAGGTAGTATGKSAAFTPAVNEGYFIIGLDFSIGNATIAMSSNHGALTTATTGGFPNYNDGLADTWNLAYRVPVVGVSTTGTVISAAGDAIFLEGLGYYGVRNFTSPSINTATSVAGTFAGTPVVVPTGAILAAYAVSFGTGTLAAADAGATKRASGTTYPGTWAMWDYAGNGASFTPQFTAPTGVNAVVIQLVLNPYHPLQAMGMGG